MFHAPFLGDALWRGRAERVVDHLEHVLAVGGEDTPALGSDFDGAIIPPRDLRSVLELPRLVESMLRRRWPPFACWSRTARGWRRCGSGRSCSCDWPRSVA